MFSKDEKQFNFCKSSTALTQKGFVGTFKGKEVFLSKNEEIMNIGELKNNNYVLRIKEDESTVF